MLQSLLDTMIEDVVEQPQDKLDNLAKHMREARNLKYEISNIELQLKEQKKRFNELLQRELPDLMAEVGQNYLELPKEGNYPSFSFKSKPFYKANIDNDSPTAPDAYEWLEKEGEGSLIKRTVTAKLGKESKDLEDEIIDFLSTIGVDCDVKFGVPWTTLTAWMKQRHKQYIEDQKNPNLTDSQRIKMPPLDLFGAYIGQFVELKEIDNG